jgi:uncharacterized protein
MSTPFLIIDGYNLLHAAGLARAKYGPGDLQRQRQQLILRLAQSLSADERARCTVVFDALDAPLGMAREFQHEGVAIRFAEPGTEADDLIEMLVAEHSSARQLIVVSSDHRLKSAARHRRASSLDSEAFLAGLTLRAPAAPSSSSMRPVPATLAKPPISPTPDVEYWLHEFGEIDVETLAQDVMHDDANPSHDPWQQQMEELQRKLNDPQQLDDWLNEPPQRGR